MISTNQEIEFVCFGFGEDGRPLYVRKAILELFVRHEKFKARSAVGIALALNAFMFLLTVYICSILWAK